MAHNVTIKVNLVEDVRNVFWWRPDAHRCKNSSHFMHRYEPIIVLVKDGEHGLQLCTSQKYYVNGCLLLLLWDSFCLKHVNPKSQLQKSVMITDWK